jgi:hypothetical protein
MFYMTIVSVPFYPSFSHRSISASSRAQRGQFSLAGQEKV